MPSHRSGLAEKQFFGGTENPLTPAMVEAGLEALRQEPNIDLRYGQAVDLVEAIIKGALAARHAETASGAG